ncbi:5-formyltetrahydrofolate cyclo-ligase [Paenibacillus flagellatus]|uniref:5-formyltetrahydrofolate cyclo-ligase n=1 Tax=Paenibacillus flagellatus TaxID=2211139 RepID=A0A2V5K1B9_9BACL|nr:5-formyltetrahydrofolate cyclo-ligase [Paenibacillus flagellatus]PYI52918.1 5-formyltetrahydrofolate cyclo-ligase [Paenibacillus flagellatus]
MTVHASKTDLRKRMEAIRSSIPAEERAAMSRSACRAAIRMLERMRAEAGDRPFTLFSYVPFRTEADVTPVMRWCWECGGRVVVPKTIRDRKWMSLHLIQSLDDLEAGAWGIREPSMSAPALERLSELDAMLVPGLAFDAKGGRLGYGGGYYDAFVRRCRAAGEREPFKLAVAFDAQIVPDVPMDDHDFRIDAVVTDRRQFTSF